MRLLVRVFAAAELGDETMDETSPRLYLQLVSAEIICEPSCATGSNKK